MEVKLFLIRICARFKKKILRNILLKPRMHEEVVLTRRIALEISCLTNKNLLKPERFHEITFESHTRRCGDDYLTTKILKKKCENGKIVIKFDK